MEVICKDCRALLDAGDGIDTRQCAICTATVCREEARKAHVRVDGGAWSEQVVCKDSFRCMVRHGQRVIKEGT